MSQDPEDRAAGRDPDYRVYGGGRSGGVRPSAGAGSTHAGRNGKTGDRPAGGSGGARPGGRPASGPGVGKPPPDGRNYTLYRSAPRGLIARLRGEGDVEIGKRVSDEFRETGTKRRGFTWRRGLAYVALAVFGWIALSVVLFFISAATHSGSLPAGAESQLTAGGPMLTSANTVAVLGLDNRPTTGQGSKEPGSGYSERTARTDSIMLWRIGGGVSRRLSIPRDTLVNIPGYGMSKINAAWAYGGPALALKVIKQFTGLQINHLVVVDLANFPKFIDDIGGVTVKTGRICSTISGGAKDGGYSLYLQPGVHHLNGTQALTLARTRDNACNAASNDLTREGYQQQIMNGIKSQLLSVHAFLHLPWAAWDAPGVIQTDMGGLTLAQLFIASEIGGSAPTQLLTENGQYYNGQDVLVPNSANVHAQVQKLLTGK